MRLSAFIQIFVPVIFGLGFVVFGIVAFIRTWNSEEQFEGRLQSIQAGKVQPEALTVNKKYVDHGGKSDWPHIVFSSKRQPNVDIAATVDFFNIVNVGDSISGYYFPDGYFFPQNHGGNEGLGKWFILSLGVLLGTGALVFALARTRTKTPDVDINKLQAINREGMDGQ